MYILAMYIYIYIHRDYMYTNTRYYYHTDSGDNIEKYFENRIERR